jgi:hypothetical protein
MGRFQNNPSIGWVHPKSTRACPLIWGNNITLCNILNEFKLRCSILFLFRFSMCHKCNVLTLQTYLSCIEFVGVDFE